MKYLNSKNILPGDFHNFGKYVFQANDKTIYKPRNIFWEWIFLDSKSPLRKLFSQDLKYKNRDLFESFPDLKFYSDDFYNSGFVEILKFDSLLELNDNINIQIGSFAAIMAWFGIGDLHFDNLAIGYEYKNQKQIFCPLDIETIFEDISLLNEIALIPPIIQNNSKFGFHELVTLYKKINPEKYLSIILKNFVDIIRFLDENENKILNIFYGIELFYQSKIRIIPRSTNDYKIALEKKGELMDPSIYLSEQTQLFRNDIPYYFRFISSRDIFHFNSPTNFILSDISQDIEKFKISKLRVFENSNLSRPLNRDLLFKSGLLQIVRYFTSDLDFFNICDNGIEIIKKINEIKINYKGEFKIKCEIY